MIISALKHLLNGIEVMTCRNAIEVFRIKMFNVVTSYK